MLKQVIVFILFLFLISGCQKSVEDQEPETKNIILFIGDGMGLAQLYAGMTASPDSFAIEKFPFSGFSKTYSADNYITDSGAGGTAIACGVKTRNGMIGLKPDSSYVASIMEIAHKNGLSTGVVSTSAVTHATPASFVAHNVNRDDYEGIAKDFVVGTVDLFFGGGKDHFTMRSDNVDLTLNLKEKGYDVIYTLDELRNSGSKKIAGLLAPVHMPKASEGRGDALSVMTKKAIETLSKNPEGFVLMVEGSMIDWAGHENNIAYLTSEVKDMDNAIGIAYDYAALNNNTLIVVTADHETGGLTLTGGDIETHQVVADFSVPGHTSVMVPIFSFGPGAEYFSGIHENTFFLESFLNLLNIN